MENAYESRFTAADHTELVKAVLEHPLHVIKYLNVPSGESPTPLDVVDAALKVRSFDAETKVRLKAARKGYLEVETKRAQDPAFFEKWAEMLRPALDQKSTADMIAAVDQLLARHDLDQASIAGLEFAKAILEDGADSIYFPTSPPTS